MSFPRRRESNQTTLLGGFFMSYCKPKNSHTLAQNQNNMIGAFDLYQLEKSLAGKSTLAIKNALRQAISTTTDSRSGEALKQAGSRAVFKDNRLQRITIRAPHYIFKQQYGFEGIKSNGVNMRLKPTNVISMALTTSNILETIADEISEIRLSEVTSKINFK